MLVSLANVYLISVNKTGHFVKNRWKKVGASQNGYTFAAF